VQITTEVSHSYLLLCSHGNQIQTWATEEGIMPNYQFGFQKCHRTSDAIFKLNSLAIGKDEVETQ